MKTVRIKEKQMNTSTNYEFKTADLCDDFFDKEFDDQRSLQICQPIFQDFGGRISFQGKIHTILCFEDNSRVREAVFTNGRDEEGKSKVLVVDGGGSLRHALMGDMLAAKAHENGWAGVIINAPIRDSEEIGKLNLGVKALCIFPLKSNKKGLGDHHVPLSFAGVVFNDGDYVYADEDGILCSPVSLF